MDEKILTTHSLKQIIDRMYPDMINRNSVTTMLKNLKRLRKISAREIADLILFIADTSHRQWSIEVILNSINEIDDSINWRGIYEKFFEEDLKIWNSEYLYTLIDCWVHISGIITVPYEIFFRRWKNRENQVEFFRILLDSDEKKTQVYSNIFFQKVVTKEELRITKYKRTIEYESNLNSVELFLSIRDIDGIELIEVIREKSPEYCILGLAAIQPHWVEIFDELLVQFSEGTSAHFVHSLLFSKYSHKMFYPFKRISDRVSLTKILDIFLEHKMLPVVTEILKPQRFCFDLIILSSRRDHLNLEVWLNNNFKNVGVSFLNYMCSKIIIHSDDQSSSSITDEEAFQNKEENADCDKKDLKSLIDIKSDDIESFKDQSVTISKKKHGIIPSIRFKADSEIFPFNKTIISTIVKILETKELPDDSLSRLLEIKSCILDQKLIEKPYSSDKATSFISEIINTQTDIEDSIYKLKELVKSDENGIIHAKKIFGLLIDNYSSLFKLPNSDTLAIFFGELIKRQIFLKPFMKVSMQLIKNSLKFPESEREYAFAFRALEVFFNDNPIFFAEIENIDSVRNALIRKELILVDEDSQAFITLGSMLCMILDLRKPVDEIDEIIQTYIDLSDSNLSVESINTRIKLHYGENLSCSSKKCTSGDFNIDSGPDDDNKGRYAVVDPERYIWHSKTGICENSYGFSSSIQSVSLGYSFTVFSIYRNISSGKLDLLVKFVLKEGLRFRDYIIETGFSIIKNCFMYKIDGEIEYFKNIGTFLGKLVLAQNKSVNIDTFDFKNFILKSIEYRRITICIYVVVNFFKEGINGITCVPNNPWLLCILDLLSELHSCTLVHIRDHIKDLFHHFGLKLTNKPSQRMKEHLVKYLIEYEGFQKQIIASSLDFSVREVCNKIVKASISVTKKTALALFKTRKELQSYNYIESDKHDSNGTRFILFRNLLVNLTRSIVHFTAQEPLKASICGNITHFSKLSSNDLPIDEVTRISNANLKICCSLVEKVAITQSNEIAPSLYNEYLKNLNTDIEASSLSNRNSDNCGYKSSTSFKQVNIKSLKVITESIFAEKTNVRSIENSEYQEIRSFLIQMGRKMPLKKKDFISNEWHGLLGEGKRSVFKKLFEYLLSISDRDDQCLSLCKYLIGHAIKTDCKDDFIFEYIYKIFTISSRTKREVLGWLIYAEDLKRYNIPLTCKFIEYDLILLEEYDQALCKLFKNDDQMIVNFSVDLLSELMLKKKKLCTVYDFIHTIETLNKLNDNPIIVDFFKRIESTIMKFGENTNDTAVFDDFIRNIHFNITPDILLSKFREKVKPEHFSFKSYLKSSWNHFVLFSGSFRFFKIDILASLVKETPQIYLKEALVFLVQAYSKRQFLFYTFFCRFIIKTLDYFEDSQENRSFLFKLLCSLSPSNFPGFTSHFIEIINHRFVLKILDKPEFFLIFKDILLILAFDNRYEYSITSFFLSNSQFSKKFNLYLNFLCPDQCVSLKNLFNQSRSKGMIDKASNPYFSAFYNLVKHIRVNTTYEILIDNLNEQNSITPYVIGCLKTMIDRNINVKEIILTLLIRNQCENSPMGIKLACEDLFTRNDIQDCIKHYKRRYFSKS